MTLHALVVPRQFGEGLLLGSKRYGVWSSKEVGLEGRELPNRCNGCKDVQKNDIGRLGGF